MQKLKLKDIDLAVKKKMKISPQRRVARKHCTVLNWESSLDDVVSLRNFDNRNNDVRSTETRHTGS